MHLNHIIFKLSFHNFDTKVIEKVIENKNSTTYFIKKITD